MRKYLERSIMIQLGDKNTLENIISEYELVVEVIGVETFKKIAPELIARTCDQFNINGKTRNSFSTYIRFYFDIEDTDGYYSL